MIFVYICLGIIALVLVAAALVSTDMNYEQSIQINASKDTVWERTKNLAALDKWSPWQDKDPSMEKTITGEDGIVGAKQSWKSNVKDVGEGSQTITAVMAPDRLETQLDFIKPFKSTAQAYVDLQEKNGSTRATWGFKSKMPYPMNLMKLFINFEKSMDVEFKKGLTRLKELSES